MTRDYKKYIHAVDLAKLGDALKRGEDFKGLSEKVNVNSLGADETVVEINEKIKITKEFIADNFDKLVALGIIKGE